MSLSCSLADESEATFGNLEGHSGEYDDCAHRAVVELEHAHAHYCSKHKYNVEHIAYLEILVLGCWSAMKAMRAL